MGYFQIINNNDNANNISVGEKREDKNGSSNLSFGAFLFYSPWKMAFPALCSHLWVPDTNVKRMGTFPGGSWVLQTFRTLSESPYKLQGQRSMARRGRNVQHKHQEQTH